MPLPAQNPNATEESVDALVEEFITGVKEDGYQEGGFSNSMYGMSKLALIAYTKTLAKKAKCQKGQLADSRKIVVTGCCPGWCRTDLTGHTGRRTAETGAKVAAWLVGEVEYDSEMSGKLYRDEKEFEWQTGNLLATGEVYWVPSQDI
ncbi:carbonyl reductase, putative [Perkinsus marinus ATCC 50983]|uniref:Carbonyl reductase, putative n=1 Tax=Perkinsus marinus (strain ATCC 50983 / TXsc) TaxID=423536 RepID=C5K5N2_PERM5|nr:carbonyl reductase, putative [Perkinsus marinus ATCC 50983]EER20189.1 carbonyl reductase, putative [Perkinsus marinus ATCC 50983]|eukprot:XP_002788393.1 carbonyl reductase, putative [Perkinsus marinus ATCC 50983]